MSLDRYEIVAALMAAGQLASGSQLPGDELIERSLDLASQLLGEIDYERDEAAVARRNLRLAADWRQVLEECEGCKAEAARRLGISVRTLFNRIKNQERR